MIDHLIKDYYYNINVPPVRWAGMELDPILLVPRPNFPAQGANERFVVLQNAGTTISVTRASVGPEVNGLISTNVMPNQALSVPVPFLIWKEGYINCLPIPPGGEVVTGEMSGCLLATFKWHNTRYAAHLGSSETDDSALTTQAWAAWHEWLAKVGVSEIKGFYPFQKRDVLPEQRSGESKSHIYGVFKDTGQFYSVLFYRLSLQTSKYKGPGLGVAPHVKRCAGVRLFHSLKSTRRYSTNYIQPPGSWRDYA